MFTQDGQEMWVGANGEYWHASVISEGVTETRRDEYRTLLRQIDISSISGDRNPDSHRMSVVSFAIRQSAWLPESPIKSILYSLEPLTTPLTSVETGDFQFLVDVEVRKACREIEVNWYICIDYED
jgi:hypothetical protein